MNKKELVATGMIFALGMFYGSSLTYVKQARRISNLQDDYIHTLTAFNEFVKAVETK